MEDKYPIIEVEADWAFDDEPMGSKDKFWLERPDDNALPWLFKYSRCNDGYVTGEHWAEKIAAELAGLLQLPHAKVDLAHYDGQWGSLSKMFDELQDYSTELVHGNELLAGALPGYDPDLRFGQAQHTLENILKAVRYGIGSDSDKLNAAYLGIGGFVVLDALVLNTDRHHENWALFRQTARDHGAVHWLAPSFDHSSSLGREQRPEKLAKWRDDKSLCRPQWYAKRGTGAVFRNTRTKRGENPLIIAEFACRRWPEYVGPWLDQLKRVAWSQVVAVVDAVPAEAMSSQHRWFAKELLDYTYTRLTRLR